MTISHKLEQLHARDIMKRTVFKLDPANTLEDAVIAFSEMHISGGPVVDRGGKLLGGLSAYDIAKPENMREGRLVGRSEVSMSEAAGDDDAYDYDEDGALSMDDYNPSVLRSSTVADFMTPDAICVAPDAPLKRVCSLMVSEHIHRVLVVEHARLIGIISSLDVVRCVSEAL